MTAVSMNRTDIPLKNVQSDSMRSCNAHDEKAHFEIKSVIMPLRNSANLSGSTTNRGGNGGGGSVNDHQTNRQPISSATHSYSSDSDIMPSTTATPSATAMRRLYFKSAKLNKTTSITTVHQQQAQHVPKVIRIRVTNNLLICQPMSITIDRKTVNCFGI